ncbi:MAG TPA: carboxypeptidase regulatory-like domain-containing protein, partial [Thermoanaerobaculia bacterium]|nr:carboxypeptidase regulatory-like domain-containing protein [Thermoanaerobaculia bacterium]
MKRTLHSLLLAILVVSTLGAAPATEPAVATEKASVSTAAAKKERRPLFRKRRPAAPPDNLVKREEPAAIRGSEWERERKQRDVTGEDDDDDKDKKVKKKVGPSPQGPPVELHMKKGSSRKFDLRSLPQTAPEKRERPEREEPEPHPILLETPSDAKTVSSEVVVPTLNVPAPATTMNFAGLDFANFGNGHPPDTVGDVGPTYYIQAINTSLGIYRKSDGVRVAAFSFDTFMSQGNFGNLCDTDNFGDPVILYDTFEDRWIVTDFAFQLDGSDNVINPPGAFQCFAVSMTGDPVSGGWSYYSLNTEGGLGDYEKFGIWPDGLYMSANMFDYAASGSFQNPRVYAFNKAQMYAGNPTVQVVRFEAPAADFTLLPSNARLQAGTPPVGAPNYFVSTWQFLNGLSVYKFHVDWNSVSLSTFTGPDVPIAGTSWPNASVGTAPSLGGNALDTLEIRAMMQNQYSNVGGAESLWATHTVRRANTTGFAAPRWYQVNVTGGTVNLTLPQAATWDPDGANVMYRFMPSLAVDRAGNLALGYSTSSSTTKPAIKYAGRLATDPVNTFGKTEQLLIQGLGTQTGSCGGTCTRWGDYSAMSLDPDGCTFWYTNMYYAADGLDHQTRIGSFAYPECTPVGAGGTISGTVTATVGGAPISGATIQLGARAATTNGSGVYSFTSIPAGTYQTIVASAAGYTSASSTNVVVTDGGTTTRNFSLALAPTSACPVDTTQANFQTGVGTNVDLTTTPGSVILLNAANVDRHADDNGFGSGYGFNNTSLIGQTFTPSVTGQLTAVDANMFCAGCSGANPNLILEVRTTSGGQPVMTAGGLLATATIAGTSSGSGGFFTFPYGTPPTLTSGTQYGIVIRTATLRATGTQAWLSSSGDVMSGGRRVNCTTSACSNPTGSNNNSDLIFKAYMKTGFATAGDFVSSVKDANPAPGITPTWTTLSWTGVTPANTTLRFQVAASNSLAGPFTFVGPNGTAGTFFTTSGASLTQFYNKRYLQYKAYLATTNTAVTPTLNDVTVCYADIDCSGTTAPITPTPAQVCSGSSGNTASGPAGATSYAWSITNGTIQGSTTSQSVTYTAGTSGTVGLMLSIVAANTCQVTNSINVTINPTPATPTVTPGGPTTFCSGGSVTLTSSSASGNQWYDGVTLLAGQTNQNYVATTSGNYNVVVTIAGCSSAPSTSTSVTVNPTPATPTVTPGGPTTFCTGGSVTLTSSSATGNQWYDGVTLLAG